jgi:predicted alpha/beta-fold hydrolase
MNPHLLLIWPGIDGGCHRIGATRSWSGRMSRWETYSRSCLLHPVSVSRSAILIRRRYSQQHTTAGDRRRTLERLSA